MIRITIHCDKCDHDLLDIERDRSIISERRKCKCGNEYQITIEKIIPQYERG